MFSGSYATRESFLHETFLPPFETAVIKGKVAGLFCSNQKDDEYATCANRFLLKDMARDQWGVDGLMVASCSNKFSLKTIPEHGAKPAENIALLLKTGIDYCFHVPFHVLFSAYKNPAGRLPFTLYKKTDMSGVENQHEQYGSGFRYFRNQPLYPFGYGKSYTTFAYNNLRINKNEIYKTEKVMVQVEVTNTGKSAGDEVVQMYISPGMNYLDKPLMVLRGFKRIALQKGETKTATFKILPEMLERYDMTTGKYTIEKGEYEILVGPDSRNIEKIVLLVQ